MGSCCAKGSRRQSLMPAQSVCWARANSTALLFYDLSAKEAREETIANVQAFQEGQIALFVTDVLMLCIGGVVDGQSALLVDVQKLQGKEATGPPFAVAYGRAHKYRSRLYVVGALDVSLSHEHWQTAAPLRYSIKTDTWTTVAAPPIAVSLCGSAFVHERIITFGGFVGRDRLCEVMLSLDVTREVWTRLDIRCPVRTALAACAALPDNSILIVGGYDPFEQYPESKDVLLFANDSFLQLPSLPSIGKLRFSDPPIVQRTGVFLLSEDDTLFKFDLSKRVWSFIDVVNTAQTHETERMSSCVSLKDVRQTVYHYQRSSCQFVEYTPKSGVSRALAPMSFRQFVKRPGILVSDFAGIVIAGGVKAVSKDREEAVDSVWRFLPSTRLAEDLPPLPAAQSCLRLLQVHDSIYAIAGVGGSETELRVHCQVLQDGAEVWQPLPDMPYATRFPGVAHFRDAVYCIAGESQTDCGVQVNLVQCFHIASQQWEVLRSEYPYGVRHLGATTLSSGILCFGGLFLSEKPTSASFLFDGESFLQQGKLQLPTGMQKAACFLDPPCLIEDQVYVYAKAGVLHAFNTAEARWRLVA